MPKNKDEFLALARERFKLSADAENQMRQNMLAALKFRAGEQWPEHLRAQRATDGRPCLTIDRTSQFIRQITNEIRQNKPSPKVRPVDDFADVETAEALQGVYRHIERYSKADAVRSWAAEYAVSIGRGFYRLITEYVDPENNDQEIVLKRIRNPFTVYFDPWVQEPDYSDGEYCFIAEDIPLKAFRAQYGDKVKADSLDTLVSAGDSISGWISEESIRVAEYWYVEKRYEDAEDGRKIERRAVKWAKITATEILEERDWPGQWIPVFPILGEELDVEGKPQLIGMVQRLMDAQRQYNYMRSAQVEAIGMAPKAPFLVAAGQVEKFPEWKSANTANHAFLRYEPIAVSGTVVGAPQRVQASPDISAVTMAVRESAEDMKAAVGMYDASLGNRSNETSGRAINARKLEGETGNYHFIDNVATTLNHEARVIIDLIPHIYDRPGRILRILGAEDEEKAIMIAGADQPGMLPQGIKGVYRFDAGRYDVAVTIGPSYTTKRMEASEVLTQLAQSIPAIAQGAPDLVVETLDIPGAQKLAERLRKMLPPGIADSDQNDPKQMVNTLMAQKQQYEQLIDALSQQVEQLSEEQRTQRVQTESKERMEMERLNLEREKLQADIAKTMATLDQQGAIIELEKRLEMLEAERQATQQQIQFEASQQADREAREAQAATEQGKE